MDSLRAVWIFDSCLAVDCVGKAGGLALLWMNEVNLQISSYSNSHIDSIIFYDGGGDLWRFISFYGLQVTSQRHVSWDLLRNLKFVSALPWLCICDFNELILNSEK